MNKYANTFKEASVILEYLAEEDYEKIPKELINVINENKNDAYEYEMNDELDLDEQPMLPETKALLFNIFRDYLSTPEQKEKIIQMQKEDMAKLKQKKSEEFEKSMQNSQTFKFNEAEVETTKETLAMVEYEKEGFWKRLLNKMFGKFSKK